MSTLLFRKFGYLVNRQSLRLIPQSVTDRTCILKWNSQMLTPDLVMNRKTPELFDEDKLSEMSIRTAAKLLSKYSRHDLMQWEKIQKKLVQLNVPNYRLAILQSCCRLKNLEAGINYLNYLFEKGEKLSIFELTIFLKLFSQNKKQILKHESLIKYIYDEIKVYMNESPVIQCYIVDLIAESPSCFYDFVKNITEREFVNGKECLLKKALALKNFDIACEIMKCNNFILTENIINSYINFLCEMTTEKKFSPQMITTFINFCEDKISVMYGHNFLSLMTTLVNNLKNHDKDYEWTLKECKINDENVCSKCKLKLVDKCISDSEYNSIKEAFLPNAGLFNKSVFLSSSENEVMKFMKFLSDCAPYDIVFDGMNIIYLCRNSSAKKLSHFLQKFLEQGLRVLVIAKNHVASKILSVPLLKNRKFGDRCQFFFTENTSDDDIFILYAALHGGLRTYLFSGDLLQKYIARFNDEEKKKIFIKWKLYHHYIILSNNVYPPLPSLGLPQLTVDENGQRFIWHISHTCEKKGEVRLNSTIPLKWICLEAKKKLPLKCVK